MASGPRVPPPPPPPRGAGLAPCAPAPAGALPRPPLPVRCPYSAPHAHATRLAASAPASQVRAPPAASPQCRPGPPPRCPPRASTLGDFGGLVSTHPAACARRFRLGRHSSGRQRGRKGGRVAERGGGGLPEARAFLCRAGRARRPLSPNHLWRVSGRRNAPAARGASAGRAVWLFSYHHHPGMEVLEIPRLPLRETPLHTIMHVLGNVCSVETPHRLQKGRPINLSSSRKCTDKTRKTKIIYTLLELCPRQILISKIPSLHPSAKS